MIVLPEINNMFSVSSQRRNFCRRDSCWLVVRKPGVERGNLSRGCKNCFFLSLRDWCTTDILIYLFIHRLVRFFSQFVRLLIFLGSNSCYLLSQVFCVYCSYFVCFFVCLSRVVYFQNQCISLAIIRYIKTDIRKRTSLDQFRFSQSDFASAWESTLCNVAFFSCSSLV